MGSPELWYDVEGGEIKRTVGYQAVCHSTPNGVPCGWKGPIRGTSDTALALRDVDNHIRETKVIEAFGSWHCHMPQAERLVEA